MKGLITALHDVSAELKGIRNILASMWHSRYFSEETDQVSPEVYADEYISTEECAKRLNISDQTIRNWILQGKKNPKSGWKQGLHYIVIPGKQRNTVRIPWNQLIISFAKGKEVTLRSFDTTNALYDGRNKRNLDYIPNPTVPDVEHLEE